MTSPLDISIHAEYLLEISGTTLRIKTLQQAIDALQRQASALNRPLTLHLATDPSWAKRVTAATVENIEPPHSPDAVISVDKWALYIDDAYKISMKDYAPVHAAAVIAAKQHQVTTVRIHRLEGNETLTVAPSPEAAPTTSGETPTTTAAPEARYAGEVHEPALRTTSEPVTFAPEESKSCELSGPETNAVETSAETPPAYDLFPEPGTSDQEIHDATPSTQKAPSRLLGKALIIGFSAALVLGGGSFAYSFLTTATPAAPEVVEAPQQSAALMPGIEASPFLELPLVYAEPVVSANGRYVALQSGESEVQIYDLSPGTAAGEPPFKTLEFAGSLKTVIQPLPSEQGEGFIIRTVEKGDALNSHATLTVWTEDADPAEYSLPVGSTLATRGGHSWLASSVATTKAREVEAITISGLKKYTAPDAGPAFFSFVAKDQALWASLDVQNRPSLIAANAKGKKLHTTKLKPPHQNANVARWLTATEHHALILWQHDKDYVLAVYNSKTGKITDQRPFKAAGDAAATPVSTDEGSIALFDDQWIDMSTGKIGPPAGIDFEPNSISHRHGGIEITEPTHTFILPNGKAHPVPPTGTVLAVTNDVVLLEQDGIAAAYRKTTEGN